MTEETPTPIFAETPDPAPVSISQQLRTAVSMLTSAASGLETAKGAKGDTAADLTAARTAATAAEADLATAKTAFVGGCNNLIGVVTTLRDGA